MIHPWDAARPGVNSAIQSVAWHSSDSAPIEMDLGFDESGGIYPAGYVFSRTRDAWDWAVRASFDSGAAHWKAAEQDFCKNAGVDANG
jgi:hypothetical protein